MTILDSFNSAIILKEVIPLDDRDTWEDAIVYINDDELLVFESRIKNATIIEFSRIQLEELLRLF